MAKLFKKITAILLAVCALCGMLALSSCNGKGNNSGDSTPAGPLTYTFEIVYENGEPAVGAMVIACIIVGVDENGNKEEGACQNYIANAQGVCEFLPESSEDEYHLKAVKGGYVCEDEYYTEGVSKTYRFVLKAAE